MGRTIRIVLLILACICFGAAMVLGSSQNELLEDEINIQENLNAGEQPSNNIDASTVPHSAGTMGPFWKVTNNGNVVYLLGSIHIAKPDMYPLHEKIESAFAESDVLAVEADVLNMNVLEVQKLLLEKALYKDGSKLSDHLSPYVYAQVKKAFANYNLSISLFERYEPWYISMLLDSLYTLKLGYDEDLGIDMHFLKQATGKKEIVELEGVEFQLDMFDQFSEDIQLLMLKGSITSSKEGEEELEKLFEIWKSADAEKLNAYLNESGDDSEEYKEYNKIVLDDRNRGMVEKIDAFLKDSETKTYFVVVGAAHYVGDMGIVKLLEDLGYTVEKQEP